MPKHLGSEAESGTHESAWNIAPGQQTCGQRGLKKNHTVPPESTRQTVSRRQTLRRCTIFTCLIIVWGVFCTFPLNRPLFAAGPLIDPLDGQPLRWRMVDADCPAEIRAQWLDANGGMDQRPCEALTLVAGNGTRVELEYRIPPSRVIDDVKATVAVKSIRSGPRVGLRICYPRIIDPASRSPKTAIIWGDAHGGRDRWEMLSVSPLSTQRQVVEMALREQIGPNADTRDMYIEAIVINAYAGAGAYTLRLDELRVDGLVAMDVTGRAEALRASRGTQFIDGIPGAGGQDLLDGSRSPADRESLSSVRSAFPSGRITRVLEYNGESLQYLKMLGFDAVLLARVPTPEFLREAIEQSMRVYSPPPASLQPDIEPFLNAIAGWYLGTSTDERQLRLAASDQQRIVAFGPLWQRPLLIAPAESWDRYAGIATSLVYDMPPYVRGLSGREEVNALVDQVKRTGRPVVTAVGIATLPPSRLAEQIDALGAALGAVTVEDYGWRWMWLQAMRGLTVAPRAIVFRSSRSLESGSELDSRRSSALGLINNWLAVVGPIISTSRFRGNLVSNREDYKLAHLSSDGAEIVIATSGYNPAANLNLITANADRQSNNRLSNNRLSNNTLSNNAPLNTDNSPAYDIPNGDSQPLGFRVPVGANNFAWRITDTTVEQLRIMGDAATRQIIIDDPDLVEWIITSNDPTYGGQLERAIRRSGAEINQYRWDLVSQSLLRSREDWRAASGGGLVNRDAIPNALLRSSAQLLSRVQPQIRSGEFGAAMRATRAADGMGLRCETMLAGRLLPGGSVPQSLPTQLAPGGLPLQMAWLPSLFDGRWSNSLLAGGDLDDWETLVRTGWTYQTRLQDQATSAVGIELQAGENATGVLRIEASGLGARPLAGGYAGTVARVISSPITFEPGGWVRIQARVKTLGFGGPNQGLLIYDSDAGSEIGALVRGNTPWTTITLYRVITKSTPLRVTFEGIGGGDASVDWVTVSMWQPPAPLPQFRPIASGRQ